MPILDDSDMIEAVALTEYSIGYTLYATWLMFNKDSASVSSIALCTQYNYSLSPSCQNSIVLDDKLQAASLSNFTFSPTGAAIYPTLNFTCDDCWLFSGFTYWYTLREYPYSTGCDLLLANIKNYLTWYYTNTTSLNQISNDGYYINQTQQWSVAQTSFSVLSCTEHSSGKINPVVLICWAFFAFLCIVTITGFVARVAWSYYNDKKMQKKLLIPFTIQNGSNGNLEISPLLHSAQISADDLHLGVQIGTGSFGEVCFVAFSLPSESILFIFCRFIKQLGKELKLLLNESLSLKQN